MIRKVEKINVNIRCTMEQHERLRNEADSKQISISRLLQEIVFAGYYKEWEPHFINQHMKRDDDDQ